jgi:Raf kinase inhibitor-like YbhB/YbcL family protein
VVFNLAGGREAFQIEEGKEPEGTGGNNSWGRIGYGGPCPPTQYEPTEHRYFFKLYALDAVLDLPQSATKTEVERAMEGHIIEQAELVGRYDRAK